jgi:hypothetical protein
MEIVFNANMIDIDPTGKIDAVNAMAIFHPGLFL